MEVIMTTLKVTKKVAKEKLKSQVNKANSLLTEISNAQASPFDQISSEIDQWHEKNKRVLEFICNDYDLLNQYTTATKQGPLLAFAGPVSNQERINTFTNDVNNKKIILEEFYEDTDHYILRNNIKNKKSDSFELDFFKIFKFKGPVTLTSIIILIICFVAYGVLSHFKLL